MTGTREIASATRHLADGGVVIFPTETVYGLAADASSHDGVARVLELKRRPTNSPLPVCVADQAMAAGVVRTWPAGATRLTDAFWPGPLTIILPVQPGRIVPEALAGKLTVGLRCPDHDIARSLIESLARPIVAPSANPHGRTAPTTATAARALFPGDDITVLDGGPCPAGIESTIIELDNNAVILRRPGALPLDDIARALDINPAEIRSAEDPSRSRNATRAPLRLFAPADWPDALDHAGGPAVVITHARRQVPTPHTLIAMPPDPPRYAAALYEALRRADEAGPAAILVEHPPGSGPIHDVILHRLTRAAR